ncbi:WD repeat-containing protein 76 isoform X1 [Triplophysa dalaica]|uniref:WD repeat-containing protein 76 isoform X1 n=2 Tax=Triplophysa dalaica TaxID=1582913 RepID=UPI0024DF9B4F|nr:WD repeat-containing protein 76 isoform X1 [Triplophysa dalaica]
MFYWRIPPQNPDMDGLVRRSSRRIRERQNYEKKEIVSPKGPAYSSEVTRTFVKRKRSVSEKDKKVQKTKVPNEAHFNKTDEGYREGLSEYELKRQETIRQNQAFLNSLNLCQISPALTLRPTQSQKKEKKVTELLHVRKSLRLQNKDGLTPLTLKVMADVKKEPEEHIEKPPGPIPLDPLNLDEHVRLPEDLLKIWNECPIKQKTETSDLKSYQKRLQEMSIDDSGVLKVVRDRIISAAFHPASSSLLMAAGSIWGQLGLLKMGAKWGDGGILLFEPHSKAISCMAFSSQPSNLITVSYDGSARSMDLEKAVFDELYRSAFGLKSFDFVSSDHSTLLIGDWSGDVAVVDRRTPGTSYESLHSMDTQTLRCIHVHPVQQQYFVVAENRSVHIYDLRSLKRRNSQVVCELCSYSHSISSAYFSPVSGNRVVTTSMDNKIRVFNTSKMVCSAPLLQSITHNMHTGRWLTKLSAMWDPKQEDCFVIGNLDRCRKIQVYHESGRQLHNFQGEHLTTVCSITAFHPSRNALLGANSTGRLRVFSDRY